MRIIIFNILVHFFMNKNSLKVQSVGRKKSLCYRYKLYLKLMMVFGINWSMEILSWAISGPAWLWYVTDMFNALYGVLIFFIFVCKANVWKLVRKRYAWLHQLLVTTSQQRQQQMVTMSSNAGSRPP